MENISFNASLNFLTTTCESASCEISKVANSFFESFSSWWIHTKCTQIPVYTDSQIEHWHQFLEANEGQMDQSESTPRKELHKENPHTETYRHSNPHDTYFDVTIDGEGKVTEENVSQVYRDCKDLGVAKPLIQSAIESMLKELKKPEGTYQIGVSLLQHRHFTQTQGMDWHFDLSGHTMVILLDDASNWTGGDFLFRVVGLFSSLFPKRMTPKKGMGVLFSNEGTQHKVEPFSTTKPNTNRTIFTVHLKGGNF